MSKTTSSAAYLSQTTKNDTFERDKFYKFFECWLSEQNQYLQNLVSASKDYETANTPSKSTPPADERALQPLLDRVIQHYENYYKAKSAWAKQDVLTMLSPTWRSRFEDAFLWIGGWRPTMAFHLLFSKSGLQLESNNKLTQLIQGLPTGDLCDLSPSQLKIVDELQKMTVREERKITEKLAKHQETVADSSMVDLSHAASERLGASESGEINSNGLKDRVDSTLALKKDGLEDILQKADDLRLGTLKAILDILTPIQAVHFLIAAAELHLRFHEWGKDRDAK